MSYLPSLPSKQSHPEGSLVVILTRLPGSIRNELERVVAEAVKDDVTSNRKDVVYAFCNDNEHQAKHEAEGKDGRSPSSLPDINRRVDSFIRLYR